MKTMTSTKGERVAVSEKELIWNALDQLWCSLCEHDEGYLCLLPRHEGIIVSSKELQQFIQEVRPKYA